MTSATASANSGYNVCNNLGPLDTRVESKDGAWLKINLCPRCWQSPSVWTRRGQRQSNSSEFSNRSDDCNKRSSWSSTEERCSTWLKSTNSSQGKKNTWEDILKQFQSMYFDIGVEFEKLLAQLKERWRALLDKYKLSVCDNNNRKGRERKTFKRY